MSIAQPLPSEIHRVFAQRFVAWQRQGLSARASSAAALACCDTIAEITRLGRSYFERQPNCGGKTLQELSTLAGWLAKDTTPVDAIAAALGLAIDDPEESREAATDVVIALRRSGYLIVAGKRP